MSFRSIWQRQLVAKLFFFDFFIFKIFVIVWRTYAHMQTHKHLQRLSRWSSFKGLSFSNLLSVCLFVFLSVFLPFCLLSSLFFCISFFPVCFSVFLSRLFFSLSFFLLSVFIISTILWNTFFVLFILNSFLTFSRV